MSATEILANLQNLSPNELEAIWREAGYLLEGRTLSGSRELLIAVDEGDASAQREGDVTLGEARQVVRSWATK